ncbi:MobC family plasmid mobilization relaxosome protein [Christensenella minuta]|uniref:MobC family plasmid mobilization relaxosome protein n=1 Tax=Christensenella minuta TaxID=626937 RepID=UPI002158989B|nr:MobC family plasmid mobilization relaxosome protein [Christensenella minuta]
MELTKNVYEICLRLNEKEALALKEKAKQCGLSKSAYLRRLILDQPVKARPPEAIHELYVGINRVGTNINQIARACNAGMTDPDSAAVQALFLLQKVYALMESVASG